MRLTYRITFYDYWHAGSGLSAGARADSTVLKDVDGLPYLAGKTIKGLTREMAELLDETKFKECFGSEGVDIAECYFSNATIVKDVANEIISNGLQEKLYDTIASTAIGDNGIAIDNSLRTIEVVVPVTLEGYIDDVPDELVEDLSKSLKMIKRIGLNRNRGLGRCEFSIKETR